MSLSPTQKTRSSQAPNPEEGDNCFLDFSEVYAIITDCYVQDVSFIAALSTVVSSRREYLPPPGRPATAGMLTIATKETHSTWRQRISPKPPNISYRISVMFTGQTFAVYCPTFLGCCQFRVVVRIGNNCAASDHVMSTSRTDARRRLQRRRGERGPSCRRVPGQANHELIFPVELLEINYTRICALI